MDISTLTAEQIASLKQQLGITTDASGRSPMKPRQLHDLRLLPTKDDPRPTFFWSAESPRDGTDLSKTTPYPKLLWHGGTGEEITVTSAAAERSYTSQGYVSTAPENAVAPDPMDAIRAALAQLSPEDRALMVEAQDQDRKAVLRAQLAALAPEELQAVLGGLEAPTKRGPGRPKREVA